MYETKYWALLPTADEAGGPTLLPELEKRRQRFLDLMDDCGLWGRVRRSLGLYHGIPDQDPQTLQPSLRVSGDEGEDLDASFNLFRSNLSLLKTYITGQKPEFDALATDESTESINATKKANQVLDAHLADSTSGLESALSQSVEGALVTTAGYLWVLWDYALGDIVTRDPEAGTVYRKGALRFINPAFTDVVSDPSVRDPKQGRWLGARRQENKWDMAAMYPAVAEKILEACKDKTKYSEFDLSLDTARHDTDDTLWVHTFFLKPSPAAPNGRQVTYIKPDVILEDLDELPGGHFPVHRLVPGQFLFTPFGFTPAFSCEAPQLLLDSVISTIASNQDALGSTKIQKKPGEPLGRAQLERGITVLECESEIKPLQLCNTPAEVFKAVELYMGFLERFSGVNATAAGQPEASLESGSALAFTAQRVQQAASDLVANYDLFIADVGTSVIRAYAIAGGQHSVGSGKYATTFTTGHQEPGPPDPATGMPTVKEVPSDFAGIDRVGIVRGNPLLRDLPGRIQVGTALRQSGDIDGDEFLTLAQTGSIDKLIQRRDNQLDLIHAENDALLAGNLDHVALETDDHILHIRLHSAVLSNLKVRNDPNARKTVLAALLEHMDKMQDPFTQALMPLLYAGPMGAPPGQPQGSPPKPDQPTKQPQLHGTDAESESKVVEAAGPTGRAA